MPDDVLRHLIGPTPVASGWVWLAMVLAAAVIGWYAAVFALTARRRGVPAVVQRMQSAVLRRRFAGAARRIDQRLRAGELDDAAAADELSGVLRDFLHQTTGSPARYLQLPEFDGDLAAAAPLLHRLNDVRFNPGHAEDARALGAATEELILSWA